MADIVGIHEKGTLNLHECAAFQNASTWGLVLPIPMHVVTDALKFVLTLSIYHHVNAFFHRNLHQSQHLILLTLTVFKSHWKFGTVASHVVLYIVVIYNPFKTIILIFFRVVSKISPDEDYSFVERPCENFFCPVTMGLLVQPHLTSCCGKHLSEESATMSQGEGKPCPLCNSTEWSSVLDKHIRREVHEVQVFCRYRDRGCQWKGELSHFHKHTLSCLFRYDNW